jgi:uncharacterized protein YjhX (UPF0386 family)
MRVGKNELKALKFLHKHGGWHSYARDGATMRIVFSLSRKRLIQHSHGQFKITKKGNAFIYDHTNRFYL